MVLVGTQMNPLPSQHTQVKSSIWAKPAMPPKLRADLTFPCCGHARPHEDLPARSILFHETGYRCNNVHL